MNGLAHPVLNDAKHGDSRVNRWWRENRGLTGLGLHCAELTVPLPSGGNLSVRCPVRRDLIGIWQRLPWWEGARKARPLLDAQDPWKPDSRAQLQQMIELAERRREKKRYRPIQPVMRGVPSQNVLS